MSDDDVIPEKLFRHVVDCSGHHADELYYRAGGTNRSQKRYFWEMDFHCLYTKIIRTVSSACSYPKTAPRRVLVFERISIEASKPKSRHFCKRRSTSQTDKFPEVTINMADKEKSTRHFSPEPFPEVSQSITRLRSGTIRPRDN